MKRSLFGLAGLVLAALSARGEPGTHLVFAHYMIYYQALGGDEAAYRREIQLAQQAGIDGFDVDMNKWSAEPRYQERTATLFQAAQSLGTGFKLFFALDVVRRYLTGAEIQDMISTYGHRPNYFTVDGRPVLTTFHGDSFPPEWWKRQVLDPLKEKGFPVFFSPSIGPPGGSQKALNRDAIRQVCQQWAPVLDAEFWFGAGKTPDDKIAWSEAFKDAMDAQGKPFMASYTPAYYEHRILPYRDFECNGGEGTEKTWNFIMRKRPAWVVLVTWNDWTEATYLFPDADRIQAPKSAWIQNGLKNHRGYLELCGYFIQGYKTGVLPPIRRDRLFYFYRTHPKDAYNRSQKLDLHGDIRDVIYVTVMLTAPADVEVDAGGKRVSQRVEAGLHHLRVPFTPGIPSFGIARNGRLILSGKGPEIRPSSDVPDYDPTSGVIEANRDTD